MSCRGSEVSEIAVGEIEMCFSEKWTFSEITVNEMNVSKLSVNEVYQILLKYYFSNYIYNSN